MSTAQAGMEQPADLVLVCAFSFFNVRLLLLSGIGKPYDAQTGQGVVGAITPTRPLRAWT